MSRILFRFTEEFSNLRFKNKKAAPSKSATLKILAELKKLYGFFLVEVLIFSGANLSCVFRYSTASLTLAFNG